MRENLTGIAMENRNERLNLKLANGDFCVITFRRSATKWPGRESRAVQNWAPLALSAYGDGSLLECLELLEIFVFNLQYIKHGHR